MDDVIGPGQAAARSIKWLRSLDSAARGSINAALPFKSGASQPHLHFSPHSIAAEIKPYHNHYYALYLSYYG